MRHTAGGANPVGTLSLVTRRLRRLALSAAALALVALLAVSVAPGASVSAQSATEITSLQVTNTSGSGSVVTWTLPTTTPNNVRVQLANNACDKDFGVHVDLAGSATTHTFTALTVGQTYCAKVSPVTGGTVGKAATVTWTATGPTATIAAGTSPVTEGTAASFTVTLSSAAPSVGLTVNLSVSESGGSDFVASANEGTKSLVFAAGETSKTYSVATVGDSIAEPNGSVTVTLQSGAGYALGTSTSASVTVNDDEPWSWAATGERDVSKEFALPSSTSQAWGIWSDKETIWVLDRVTAARRLMAYDYETKARVESRDKFIKTPWMNGIWSDGETLYTAYELLRGNHFHNSLFLYSFDKSSSATTELKSVGLYGGTAHEHSHPAGVWSDGVTMYVADYASNSGAYIFAYDKDTIARDSAKDFGAIDFMSTISGIWSDGTTMWVADPASAIVFAINMETKERDFTKELNIGLVGNNAPRGMWSDGTTLWIVDGVDKHVYAYSIEGWTTNLKTVSDACEHNAASTIYAGRIRGTCPSSFQTSAYHQSFVFEVRGDRPRTRIVVHSALDTNRCSNEGQCSEQFDPYLILLRAGSSGGLSGSISISEHDDIDTSTGNMSAGLLQNLEPGTYVAHVTTYTQGITDVDFTIEISHESFFTSNLSLPDRRPEVRYFGPVTLSADARSSSDTTSDSIEATLTNGTLSWNNSGDGQQVYLVRWAEGDATPSAVNAANLVIVEQEDCGATCTITLPNYNANKRYLVQIDVLRREETTEVVYTPSDGGPPSNAQPTTPRVVNIAAPTTPPVVNNIAAPTTPPVVSIAAPTKDGSDPSCGTWAGSGVAPHYGSPVLASGLNSLVGCATVTEGRAAVFHLSLDRPAEDTLQVHVVVSDVSGSNFLHRNDEACQIVTFARGQQHAQLGIPTRDDGNREANGYVWARLGVASGYSNAPAGDNYTLGDTEAKVQVLDNDPTAALRSTGPASSSVCRVP